MKQFVALIPARGGSKGIKNKNLVKINNNQLQIQRSNFAINAKIFSKIILSSDNEKILNRAKNKKITIHKRSKKLSTDRSLLNDTIFDIISVYNLKKNYILIILEPTSPLRNLADLKIAINKIIKNNLDSIVHFSESFISPYRIWDISNNYIKPFIINKKLMGSKTKF